MTYRNEWIRVEQHLTDSQIVYIVNHAGDSHVENSNNGRTLNHSVGGGLKAIETAHAYIIQHKTYCFSGIAIL